MRHLLKFVAIGGLLMLGFTVGLRLWYTFTSSPTQTADVSIGHGKQPETPSLAIDAFSALPISAYPQTLTRPIFFEGRRFPEARVEVPETITAPPPSTLDQVSDFSAERLKLHGVQISAGKRKALIRAVDSEPAWHVIGDAVEGWVLTDITAGYADLKSGEREVRLWLYDPQPNQNLTPQ